MDVELLVFARLPPSSPSLVCLPTASALRIRPLWFPSRKTSNRSQLPSLPPQNAERVRHDPRQQRERDEGELVPLLLPFLLLLFCSFLEKSRLGQKIEIAWPTPPLIPISRRLTSPPRTTHATFSLHLPWTAPLLGKRSFPPSDYRRYSLRSALSALHHR